jgi:putative FmdB family regulatory protein
VPTYQYACTSCGHQLEAVQSFTDAPLTECPECAGRLRKLFSSVGIVFKGSGFYRNDSRAAASKDAGTNDSGTKDSGAKEPAAKDSGSKDGGSKDGGAKDGGTKDGGAKSSGAKQTASSTKAPAATATT